MKHYKYFHYPQKSAAVLYIVTIKTFFCDFWDEWKIYLFF